MRKQRRTLRFALRAAACLAAGACGSGPLEPEAHLVVDFPSGVRVRDLRIEPLELARRAQWLDSRLVLTVPARENSKLELSAPNTCPLTLDLARLTPGETSYHTARPWIDLGPPRADLGPGSQVRIDVQPGCASAKGGRITWKLALGTLDALHTEQNGFVLTGRLPELDELFEMPLPPTLVPVSPEHQGRVVLEARFTLGAVSNVARLELSALSRSRGLPNVPTGASVLLGGAGWQLLEPARDEPAMLQSHAGYSLFRPAHAGRWHLRSPEGNELTLKSAAYDQVPLDCTRAACHENLAGHAAGKMSDVLVRGLRGQLGADYQPACALACHALGEPGIPDGGFHDVASSLGVDVNQVHSYAALPAALQRLSNVGCLSCHGPGAIPEPAARSRILRSDVCAYCHDAPPRYGHVAAWQQSAMSQASRHLPDGAPEGCAACHTTRGFLEAQAARDAAPREAPAGTELGLDCVVCHDVHQPEGTRALLRSTALPPSAEQLDASMFPTSRTCLSCHAPRAPFGAARQAWPEASAAALWLGRGGFARTGGALTGPAVHARTPEGCLSCHTGTKSGLERGANHGFQANTSTCRGCHERLPSAPDYSAKARSLLSELVQREPKLRQLSLPPSGTRPHAHSGELDVSTPLGRAAYNLLLLVEDPAAGIHNPDYAKLLLDHSEGMLQNHADEPEPPPGK